MKRILLISPISRTSQSSGITIRVGQLKDKFESLGFKADMTDSLTDQIDKYDYVYIMVSTKENSISSQVAKSQANKKLIVDLYTPLFLEKEASMTKWNLLDFLNRKRSREAVGNIIKAGTYFLLANKRQKKYWQKIAKRFNYSLQKNHMLTVPTGVPPLAVKRAKSHKVILWFGGIYPWMDPYTMINAFALVAPRYKGWKLHLLGGFHPKTGYQDIFKRSVNRIEKKIPKDQYQIIPWQTLNELPKFFEDVAFSVHIPKQTPEDYYSHRTRILTLLNCGIPIITSGRDAISDLLVKEKAGTYSKQDERALAEEISKLIDSPRTIKLWSKNAKKIEEKYLKAESEPINF